MSLNNGLSTVEHNRLVSFIWSVADDCLRDVYVRGKYRDVILPMTVIRRLDSVLEPTKKQVLETKKMLDENGVLNQGVALSGIAGQSFYNTSEFTLKELLNSTSNQNMRKNFESYLDGFSDNVKEILQKFKFKTQITTMSEAGILGSVIEKFTSNNINLSPYEVKDENGKILHKGLDNHAMGTLFEELIRKFNEENNEEAGEHFTPRDVVELMADLAILPVMDKIKDSTYTIYDGAAGTLGMGTVAAEKLENIALQKGKTVSTHIFGQEVNAETYAIAKADILIKGEGTESDHVYYGSTLSDDQAYDKSFDFMLSNPPYGKSWKVDKEKMGGDNISDPRFIINYGDNPEYAMLPRVSDGQLLFLLNNISKMKNTDMGSRILEVHNGSALFTGDAEGGESNARRYMLESDLIEAIIQLPENIFYNTGITTYIWILSNRKEERRKGKIQLIDASSMKKSLRKNMGKKNCELSTEDKETIISLYSNFEENEYSKIFSNEDFGYYKITIERPLRIKVSVAEEKLEKLKLLMETLGVFDEEVTDSKIKKAEQNGLKQTKASKAEVKNTEKMIAYYEVLKSLENSDDYLDYVSFEKEFNKRAKGKGLKQLTLSKFSSTGLFDMFSEKDENAEPIKKSNGEFESDADLRDTEIVPLLFEGGIEEFFNQEVLPYHNDAWIDYDVTKIGYEINFMKYFYKPKQLDSVEVIVNRIMELEKESDGMMAKILEGLQ